MAYHTFAHVLDLDISFHLERRTGALSRVLERGARRPDSTSGLRCSTVTVLST